MAAVPEVSRNQLQDAIKTTKSKFLNVNPTELQEHLYNSYSGISNILLKYRNGGGAAGWSEELNDYTPEERHQLENSIKQLAGFIDPILLGNNQQQSQQKGGANLRPSVSDDAVISYSDPFGPLNPDDISIDRTYKKLKDFISSLDEKNRVLAKTLGPFRFIDEMRVDPKIPLPPPLPPLSIPAKAIIPAIMTFLELLRVFVSFGPMSNDFLRKTFSLVLAFADIATGSWKNAVLSGLGAFGSYPLLLGIIGKLLNNTFELMSPEIQTELSDIIFKGTKSVFVGFWLYLFSILSPDFIRGIVNTSLATLEKPLEEFNKKMGALEEKLEANLAPKGLHVSLPKIPMELLPSLDDIQNIQILAARPEIYCSPEFQQVIDPLMKIVPLRLVLELLGVPTQADDIATKCKGVPTEIVDAVVEKLEPKVEIIPGGPLNFEAKLPKLPNLPNIPKLPNTRKIAFPPTPVRRGGGSRKYKKTRRSRQSRRSRH
jgi:hypothetical protein